MISPFFQIRANFCQYGLETHFGDVVVCDASRPPWHVRGRLGAIVCDPPYGIREPTTRNGVMKKSLRAVKRQLF